MPDPPLPFLTPVFTLSMSEARASSESGEQETGTSSLARELGRLRREITDVGDKIGGIEKKLEAAEADQAEKQFLRSELKLLREKENLLLQKELKLMGEAGTGTHPILK